MAKDPDQSTLPTHGAAVLPSVEVDSYNLEVEDDDGFVGDKASRGAFREMLDKWRQPLRELGEDPLTTSRRGDLEARSVLAQGTPEAAGVVQAPWRVRAARRVIRRFLRQKDGGTPTASSSAAASAQAGSASGIARTELILKAESPIDIELIRHDRTRRACSAPRTCGRCWAGYEGILAVDVGGTNIRTGVAKLNQARPGPVAGRRAEIELWRHGDEDVKRDDAVDRLVEMLEAHVKDAKKTG
jgi:hypothetical protein